MAIIIVRLQKHRIGNCCENMWDSLSILTTADASNRPSSIGTMNEPVNYALTPTSHEFPVSTKILRKYTLKGKRPNRGKPLPFSAKRGGRDTTSARGAHGYPNLTYIELFRLPRRRPQPCKSLHTSFFALFGHGFRG